MQAQALGWLEAAERACALDGLCGHTTSRMAPCSTGHVHPLGACCPVASLRHLPLP